MGQARIPLAAGIHIEEFSGGSITIPNSHVINGRFMQRPDKSVYVTQRPAINISQDASDTVSLTRGRGIYYWDTAGELYFVNDNKVYKTDYSTEVNEASKAVTLTGTGATATATAAGHGYSNGDKITISGATDTNYNGEYAITNVAANTFDYASTGSGADSGTAVRGLGGGGTYRVDFIECGNYLVIIDQEDNKGWYIDQAADTVLVEITDADFPSNNSLQLSRGAVVLNGTLYVMDTTGTIASSGIEDPSTWAALDIKEAEIEKDGGVAITLHHNHIAAFGNRTLEFFYDNANPTNSPLEVRLDISYQIGAAEQDTIWVDQNMVFFCGQSRTGEIGVYQLAGMVPKKVSTPDIDSLITSAVALDFRKLVGSGFAIGGGLYYVLTIYNIITDVTPITTLVYDAITKMWGCWELMHTGIDDFPVVDWATSNATLLSKGILSNGDIVDIIDDLNPQDVVNAVDVYVSGVYESDVFSSTNASGTAISLEIIPGKFDGGTRNRKMMSSLRLIATPTKASQTMTVQWSDESNEDWNAGRTLDMSIDAPRIPRMGSFRQRNFKLTYAGTEAVELEGLEVELNKGNH